MSAMIFTAQTPIYNARQKTIRDAEWEFVRHVLPATPGRFLDIGCGTGYQMDRAKAMGFEVSGVDPCPSMYGVGANISEDIRSAICRGTAEQLPFPDSSFDVVFSSHVLVELEDITPALREARRVLKPDGRLVLVLNTAIMAWIRMLSLLAFDTHHRIAAFLRSPSREHFKQIRPPAYRGPAQPAWKDVSTWSVRNWRALLSPLFEVQHITPTMLYSFPDYRPFLFLRRPGRLCSSVVITARPRPVVM